MGFYVIHAVIRCYEEEGVLLSLSFFHLLSKDGFALLISDLSMVSMTLFSVLFSKLFVWEILPYETFGVVIQHICQALFLFFNIYWTFFR
jgi:sterol O-acyltransferase